MTAQTTPNSEQIEYWNNQAAKRWLEMQAQLDQIVRPFGEAAMQAAGITDGLRVLDIGCGCGDTTLALATQVGLAGQVTGADISRSMLQRGRDQAQQSGITQVAFKEADAQTHPFPKSHYHRVYSRFGVMFFDDPSAAFSNLYSCLLPGGIISFICWQPPTENPWLMTPLQAANQHLPPPEPPPAGAPGPFSLADHQHVETLLKTAGFTGIQQRVITRPITLGRDAAEATHFAVTVGPASNRFKDLPAEQVSAATAAIEEVMQAHQTEEGVVLSGSARVVVGQRPE